MLVLLNEKYIENCYFNPIQDINDNWVITINEIRNCKQDYKPLWLDSLPLVNFKPKEEKSILVNN